MNKYTITNVFGVCSFFPETKVGTSTVFHQNLFVDPIAMSAVTPPLVLSTKTTLTPSNPFLQTFYLIYLGHSLVFTLAGSSNLQPSKCRANGSLGFDVIKIFYSIVAALL